MKHKWYRSKVTKTILVIAEHVLAMLMIVSVLCALAYPALTRELIAGERTERYEDSGVYNETLMNYSSRAVDGIWIKGIFETKGKYDEDKIIDIQEFFGQGVVSGENAGGLSYRLGDLLAWDLEGESAYEEPDDSIIVCERKDGTYYYYRYGRFAALISEGKLKLNGFIKEEDNLLEYLQNMGDTRENFLQIQNSNGGIMYVNCWKYDGTFFKEHYKPIGADSILEIVNKDERWNGRLQDAYDMIYNTVYTLRDYQQTYYESVNLLKEGDTNFRFVYIDKASKKVYSNWSEFTEYKDARNYVDAVKGLGAYVAVEPELTGFKSSIPGADAQEWRNTIRYSGSSESDYIFIAAVDRDYPVQDNFAREKQNYETYAEAIKMLIVSGAVSVLFWIIGMIWLTMTAGKNSFNEEVTLKRFDSWKTEIAVILISGLCLAAGACGCVLFSDNISSRYYVEYREMMATFGGYNEGYPLVIAASAGLILIAFTFFLIGYLSFIRRIKAKTLWKDSILKMIIVFMRSVFSHIHELWKTVLIFVAFVVVHWLPFAFYYSGWDFICFIIMAAFDILAGIYLIVYVIGREKIKGGIQRIAEGEVDYKIPTEKMLPAHKKLAEVVNDIGAGLDAAVERSMKSERLKTDLITNVSHDIKTPLTSIINYIDLLKKENFKDEKVQHYIEVLEQKAQRLKVLTEDVVEASKVSSGNVTLEYMRINFVEMIQQTSGEFEEKFKKRGLKEILRLPEEDVIIRVDGRRTWRILENIYNNAVKYAMEGSRVYADLKVIEGKARFELKNISEQPLNISAEELTERFIRGDLSRSTEGSGLGLSIARSLTELQGGTFELYLDGDLFKVIVEFDRV